MSGLIGADNLDFAKSKPGIKIKSLIPNVTYF